MHLQRQPPFEVRPRNPALLSHLVAQCDVAGGRVLWIAKRGGRLEPKRE
jgi:hypothetical protein